MGGGDLALTSWASRAVRVVNPRLCTVCNRDLFYSYRMEGPVTGRHGCVAWTVGVMAMSVVTWTDGCEANLAVVERRIEAARLAGRSERPSQAARGLQVSWRPDDMAMLAEAGIRLVGENRAEGLEEKWQPLERRRSSSTSSVICRAARCGRCCPASP